LATNRPIIDLRNKKSPHQESENFAQSCSCVVMKVILKKTSWVSGQLTL